MFFFSCRERERDPGGEIRKGRNMISMTPSVNIPHVGPLCSRVWKCPHESSSVLRDEAVTSTLPLCLFSPPPLPLMRAHGALIRHYPAVIMVISGDLSGSSATAVCHFHKRSTSLSEGREDFGANTQACCRIFTVPICSSRWIELHRARRERLRVTFYLSTATILIRTACAHYYLTSARFIRTKRLFSAFDDEAIPRRAV